MSETKSMTTKQQILVISIGVVFVLLLVSLVVSAGSSTGGQDVEVDRETCLQQGNVWSETNQQCYNSTAVKVPGV
jgi:nicotinamide riboside transporter PnuC